MSSVELKIGDRGVAALASVRPTPCETSLWPTNRGYRYVVAEAPTGEPWVLFMTPSGGVDSANVVWFLARFTPVNEFDDLVELVKRAPQPSKKERDLQAIGFAYSNLAMSTNHKPSRAAFKLLAMSDRFGWSEAEFDEWASTKDSWVD